MIAGMLDNRARYTGANTAILTILSRLLFQAQPFRYADRRSARVYPAQTVRYE